MEHAKACGLLKISWAAGMGGEGGREEEEGEKCFHDGDGREAFGNGWP